MKKRTGSFSGIGEDGRQYTVFIYTNYSDAGTFEDPNAVVEGKKQLRTSNGLHVNRLQKGEYKIVETGIVISSSSPDAP